MGGFCGCWQSLVGCYVFRASLLPSLGGRGHSLVGCCVVVLGQLGLYEQVGFLYHYMGSTWWKSGCGLSLGDVLRLWAEPLAWWWLVEEGRHVTRM